MRIMCFPQAVVDRGFPLNKWSPENDLSRFVAAAFRGREFHMSEVILWRLHTIPREIMTESIGLYFITLLVRQQPNLQVWIEGNKAPIPHPMTFKYIKALSPAYIWATWQYALILYSVNILLIQLALIYICNDILLDLVFCMQGKYTVTIIIGPQTHAKWSYW